jgi:hypothetical protein
MSVVDRTRSIFDARIRDASGLPKLFFENSKFNQVADVEHVRTRFTITSRRTATLGGTKQLRYQGLYTMTICVPEETGSGAAMRYADILMDTFPNSEHIGPDDFRISLQYTELGGAFAEEPFYCLPVRCVWYFFR